MTTFSRLALRLLVLCLVLGSISSCKKTEDTPVYGNWTKGNTFDGAARTGAVSFLINNVAYVGTGIDANGTQYNDLWSFDPASGKWTPLTPMPAAAGNRYYAVAFAAAGKGYVGTGYSTSTSGTKTYSDFWQFDPTVNTTTTVGGVTTTTVGSWKQVADLTSVAGGSSRYYAVAGSVADKGYVGCGYDGISWKKDFYRYDPTTDKWSAFGFPGDKRAGSFAFTLNGQMYVGGGTQNGQNVTDLYAYNPVSDSWTRRNDLANVSNSTTSYDYSSVYRVYGSAFTVGDKAYVAVGSNGSTLTSVYVYDPTLDTWTLKNPFKGSGRNSAVAFGIGNYGYVGLGGTSSTSRFDDFWKFDPNAAQQ